MIRIIIGIAAIGLVGFLVFRVRKGSGGGAPTAGDENIDV
jgi:hypothetical protein